MAAAQWVGSDLMHASTAAGAIGIGVTGEFNATHVQWKETGNWTDRKIANHYVKEALYVKGKPAGGKTVGKVTAYANKDASVTAEVNVNWYVQQKYAGTDVVTRELDHVQDWRDWTNAAKNAIFLSFANANKSYGSTEQLAGAVQEYLTPRTKEFAETQWWRYDRGGGPHDLNYYPAQPAQVPEYDPTH